MEMASWDGGISRTVQFLVPKVRWECADGSYWELFRSLHADENKSWSEIRIVYITTWSSSYVSTRCGRYRKLKTLLVSCLALADEEPFFYFLFLGDLCAAMGKTAPAAYLAQVVDGVLATPYLHIWPVTHYSGKSKSMDCFTSPELCFWSHNIKLRMHNCSLIDNLPALALCNFKRNVYLRPCMRLTSQKAHLALQCIPLKAGGEGLHVWKAHRKSQLIEL